MNKQSKKRESRRQKQTLPLSKVSSKGSKINSGVNEKQIKKLIAKYGKGCECESCNRVKMVLFNLWKKSKKLDRKKTGINIIKEAVK